MTRQNGQKVEGPGRAREERVRSQTVTLWSMDDDDDDGNDDESARRNGGVGFIESIVCL